WELLQDSPVGRWAQTDDGYGRHVEERPGAASRASEPRGSGIAAALDLQEGAQVGGRTPAAWASDQASDGGRTAPRTGLQSTGESQDIRGQLASGPPCAV